MSNVRLAGLPNAIVRKIRASGKDANGQPLEVQISDGNGNPCRHCLEMIGEGEEYYILSHRPFTTVQPYAEQGPIFLHVDECCSYEDTKEIPDAFTNKETVMLRGYDRDERIVYGTGKIVPTTEFRQCASDMLSLERVEFVYIRSSANNCYQARVDRVRES